MKLKTLQTLQKGTDSLQELLMLLFTVVFVSAVLFSVIEHVSLFDSIYWSFVTGLSIGYGDISPHTDPGKVVAIVHACLMLLFVLPLFIGHAVQKLLPNRNEFTHEEQEEILEYVREQKKNGTI